MQRRTDGNVEGFSGENVCTPSPILEKQDSDVKTAESAENFQKSMYDLFEKNGVINDLRAYLRGHIVEVLRSTRTGNPPACLKNFTRRLELPLQALNMLLVEYLLRYEYSYTLSVFISEIPLANMVFSFAKSLMQDVNKAELRFIDEDVWSILSYLGVKCDSQHAADIVKLYKSEKQSPLLLCMLKCMTLYKEPHSFDSDASNSNSLSSSVNSLSTNSHKSPLHHITMLRDKCKHSAHCKICKSKILRIREKYKKKKKNYAQKFKKTSVKPQMVDSLIKNIDTMERSFIDEMFQQLKSVYETELEMARVNEETRLKKAIAKQAVQLQQKQNELEERFKARESELQCNIKGKKRFLWGLAQLLREQHAQMSRAMRGIREETSKLAAKEASLKSQLADAEQILHERAEDMRNQISKELSVLENHLQSMKDERDTINKERSELDQIRNLCESGNNTTRQEDPNPPYNLLRDEFQTVLNYLETVKLAPRCVVENATMTELADVTTKTDVVLNNGQDVERSSIENVVKDQVVNNLKKLKNVNVSQSNLDERKESNSTVSSEVGERELRDRDSLRRLAEENERLRTFARQQREHIDELSSQQTRLRAELAAARQPCGAAAAAARPRTAPARPPVGGLLIQRPNTCGANTPSQGWRKGAGEELNYLAGVCPRLVLPGDALPFVGVVTERRSDNRRYLINQWRSLQHRFSPTKVSKPNSSAPGGRHMANTAGPSVLLPSVSQEDPNDNEDEKRTDKVHYETTCEPPLKVSEDTIQIQGKSSKSSLREGKKRLETKDSKSKPSRAYGRGQSPTTVLREAKLRLRKLEIEAEAVEKSYLDFRRKQEALSDRRCDVNNETDKPATEDIDLKNFRPSVSFETRNNYNSLQDQPKTVDYSKYIEEYYAKYDIGESHFKNKNSTSVKVKPIPSFTADEAALPKEDKKENYLETPIAEFRKYYHSEKQINDALVEVSPKTPDPKNSEKAKRPLKSSIFVNLFHDKNDKSPSVQRLNSESESLSKSSLSINGDNTISIKISPKLVTTKKENFPERDTKDSLPTTLGKIDVKPTSPIAGDTKTSDRSKDSKKETPRLLKQGKAKELEKQNITETEKTITKNNSSSNDIENPKLKIEVEKSIVKEILTDSFRDETASKELEEDKNSLVIEIQSISQVKDVKITESQTQDLLLFIQSSESKETNPDISKDAQFADKTLLVNHEKNTTEQPSDSYDDTKSPKNLDFGEKSEDQNAQFLNSNYKTDEKELDLNKEDWFHKTDLSANDDPYYPDDFSAPKDNSSQHYNTDSEDRSPISMPKISENDDFWDS